MIESPALLDLPKTEKLRRDACSRRSFSVSEGFEKPEGKDPVQRFRRIGDRAGIEWFILRICS